MAMRVLATDDELLSGLRSRGLARAADFSWHAAASQVLDVYRMLVQGRGVYNGHDQSTTEGKTFLGPGRGVVEE